MVHNKMYDAITCNTSYPILWLEKSLCVRERERKRERERRGGESNNFEYTNK